LRFQINFNAAFGRNVKAGAGRSTNRMVTIAALSTAGVREVAPAVARGAGNSASHLKHAASKSNGHRVRAIFCPHLRQDSFYVGFNGLFANAQHGTDFFI
jgi:hypothetical protein